MAPDAASTGQIFSRDTQAIFFNFKPAAQRMLDADYLFGETGCPFSPHQGDGGAGGA